MQPPVMILAAGEGRRMRPLTLTQPKPLLSLAGKPLIVHWLERLAIAGVRQVVINTGYLGEQLPQALGDGQRWGLKIDYSAEALPLETGGGLLKALPLLMQNSTVGQAFWLVNGDLWCPELPPLPSSLPLGQLGLLLLVANPSHNPQGDFCYDNNSNELYTLDSKPKLSKPLPSYTFAGISILHTDCLQAKHLQAAYGYQPAPNEAFALAPLLGYLAAKKLIKGQLFDGQWVDVGTPERLKRLREGLF